jgi:hypothetical protein
MRYIVEPIGAQFSNSQLPGLASTLGSHQGYRLHSVFQVTQPGCLGIGQATTTYLAIYESTND